MHDDEKPNLRRLALFRDMGTPTFDYLMQIAHARTVPPQFELISQGAHADFLHVIIEGSIELRATWNGHDTMMGIVHPVSAFILAACVCDQPYLMSARTRERSRVVMIPVADVRIALRRDSDFAMAAMRELAEGYRTFGRYTKNLKLRDSLERLAAYILYQSHKLDDAPCVVLPVEKRHLASYLGMTPENLSRSIKAVQDHGVTVRGVQITITDRARLAAIAVPDPLIDGPGTTTASPLPARRSAPH